MVVPGSVKVGGIEYEVKIVPFVEINQNRNYKGVCHNEESRIEVMQGMSRDKAEQTFVHELVHAMFNEAGFDNHDEDVVNRLGIVLHQVLRDNPDLIGIGSTMEEVIVNVGSTHIGCDCDSTSTLSKMTQSMNTISNFTKKMF